MDTRTIMIVEDDREIRALLADLLTREGYAPVCVENGAAMDRALMQACPDLIVLDIMLPGEDGLSICQRLRSKSRTPILMLTAKADDVDRIIGLELGADDYLPKPFNPRECWRASRPSCGVWTARCRCRRRGELLSAGWWPISTGAA